MFVDRFEVTNRPKRRCAFNDVRTSGRDATRAETGPNVCRSNPYAQETPRRKSPTRHRHTRLVTTPCNYSAPLLHILQWISTTNGTKQGKCFYIPYADPFAHVKKLTSSQASVRSRIRKKNLFPDRYKETNRKSVTRVQNWRRDNFGVTVRQQNKRGAV